MKRKTSDKYFQKLCGALNECNVILQKIPRIGRTAVGGIHEDDTICIRNRPDKENLVLILIHEVWHYLRPKWSEKHIENWSRKLFCEFSTDQYKILSRYLRRH